MESRFTFFGHPVHAMLVVFPLGLFFTAVLFDLAYLWRRDAVWRHGAFWMIAIGEVAAIAAVIAGVADYLAISMPVVPRRLATLHLFLGLAVTLLYGLQVWLRRKDAGTGVSPRRYPPALFLLTAFSASAVGVQGWLGGELSHVYRVGVMPEPGGTPRSPTSGAKPASGAEIYQRACAGCHGSGGEGDLGPRLAGTERAYSIQEIATVVTNGRPPLMPSFGKLLPPSEIKSVSAYVGSLMRKSRTGSAPAAPGREDQQEHPQQ